MIHLSKNEFPLILREIPVVLYGGGAAGRLICDLLIQNDIRIMYIVDDSVSLCGSYIRQIKVISYNEFCEYIKEYEKVAVIMTTIYGKSVLNKMCLIHNIIVYELYDWFMKLNGDEKWLQEMFRDTINVQQMKIQIGLLRGKWADKESEYVLDAIMNYVDKGDLSVISEVCTVNEHYFIPEVIETIKSPLTIIDGGACKGELLDALFRNNLDYERCYFFETDSDNYNFLVKLAKKQRRQQHIIIINKGLWSETKKLYFTEGTDCASGRIVDYETNHVIDTVSIDEYFQNQKCNYIKMDIEGAEYEALIGGMQVIKRDRPILAISVYHFLEDFWRIPKYLMSELSNYRYYVRQHALIYGETVLYGIPNEI